MHESLNILIFEIISRKIEFKYMCIAYKMNVVVTRSPF